MTREQLEHLIRAAGQPVGEDAGGGSVARALRGSNPRPPPCKRLADPNARLTLVRFDSEDPHEVIIDGSPLAEIDEAHAVQQFDPRAATPLYDAIAALIGRADKHLANAGEGSDQLVVIFTDGLENASTD